MGERKVLNKYFSPEFNPEAMPRLKKKKYDPTNRMSVTMMMPMSVMCHTCGEFIYKGTKFVMRKEDVVGQNYLGIQIFRFAWRCPKCSSELSFITDPKNHDYIAEKGCKRTYEPWKAREQEAAKEVEEREAEEAGNAMKALENRTLDSKREMDVLAALDETRALNIEKHKLDIDAVIAQAANAEKKAAAAREEMQRKQEDMEVAVLLEQQRRAVRRIEDDDAGEGTGGEGDAPHGKAVAAGASGAGAGGATAFAVGAEEGGKKTGAKSRVRMRAKAGANVGASGGKRGADAAGGAGEGKGEGATVRGEEGAKGGGAGVEAGGGGGGGLGLVGYGSESESG